MEQKVASSDRLKPMQRGSGAHLGPTGVCVHPEKAEEFSRLRRLRLRGEQEDSEELLQLVIAPAPRLPDAPLLPDAQRDNDDQVWLKRAVAKRAAQAERVVAVAQQVSNEILKANADANPDPHGCEYQIMLNQPLFMRSRLRIRRGEDGVEIRCESDSADESEWFKQHHADLLAALRVKGYFDVRLIMGGAE